GTFEHLGIPEAADDPRFTDAHKLIENSKADSDLVVKAIGSKSFAYWRKFLTTMKDQWVGRAAPDTDRNTDRFGQGTAHGPVAVSCAFRNQTPPRAKADPDQS